MSETERLIELVRKRRFLYDIKDPDYKTRAMRIGAWKEIAREMGSGNVNIWSAKWKGLKDNYAKHKKTSDPHYAISYKKYKHWPWAEHVRFLDECSSSTTRRACTHIRPKEDSQDSTLQSITQLYIPGAEDINGDSSMLDPSELEGDVLDNVDSKKRKFQNDSNDVQEASKKKKSDDKVDLDGVDHFFLSYAQSFKQLPSRMQIMLKLEIATLFSRYELQAQGVTKESLDSIPRIVPLPVKSEFEFTYTIND